MKYVWNKQLSKRGEYLSIYFSVCLYLSLLSFLSRNGRYMPAIFPNDSFNVPEENAFHLSHSRSQTHAPHSPHAPILTRISLDYSPLGNEAVNNWLIPVLPEIVLFRVFGFSWFSWFRDVRVLALKHQRQGCFLQFIGLFLSR